MALLVYDIMIIVHFHRNKSNINMVELHTSAIERGYY